ncbi:MAG: hypothetical protein S4CHLAM20_04830 [Chlamydiia bacterium]|nr:hypothetical protein [Chlamydiia bacterium]
MFETRKSLVMNRISKTVTSEFSHFNLSTETLEITIQYDQLLNFEIETPTDSEVEKKYEKIFRQMSSSKFSKSVEQNNSNKLKGNFEIFDVSKNRRIIVYKPHEAISTDELVELYEPLIINNNNNILYPENREPESIRITNGLSVSLTEGNSKSLFAAIIDYKESKAQIRAKADAEAKAKTDAERNTVSGIVSGAVSGALNWLSQKQ